jgi:ferric-dicitrate binding protein FerR (iron transport regulator)
MTNKSDIKSLIKKFVENQASEEEIELLQEHFKTPEGLKCMDEVINEYAADFDRPHLTLSSNALQESLRAVERSKRSLPLTSIIRVVAATFIGIILLVGLYFYFQTSSLVVYKTVARQKTTITLPDNTVVTLNGNSSLSYRDNWEDEKRRSVDLSGEAFFNVISDAEKPFVVNTSGISVRVLGTTFNIKSYDDDERVETTLIEGKVVIEKSSEIHVQPETIELLPHQQATFNKENNLIIVKKVDLANEVAWLTGSLVFEDEPFSEIIKDLERWYGTKITVKDKSSLQCRFSTRIEGESLEEVLRLFSLSGDAKYQFHKDQVSIEGSLCNQLKH